MQVEGEAASRTTLYLHPRAYPVLNLQLFLHYYPPRDGSQTPPSLTQPQPYLAPRAPRTAQNQHSCLQPTLLSEFDVFLHNCVYNTSPIGFEVWAQRKGRSLQRRFGQCNASTVADSADIGYCAISINSAGHVTRYMPAEILNSAHGGNGRYKHFFSAHFYDFVAIFKAFFTTSFYGFGTWPK